MTIHPKYGIGDAVYLKTDPDQHKRMVIGIKVNAYDMLYEIICGLEISYHYDFEISTEKMLTNI